MRTLVVGAGAVGGYFGGRLLETGRDVTFLVRPRRAHELYTSGLRIRSRFGDVAIAKPATILALDLDSPFDLVLLSCKAYDLDNAIASFAPAVGPETVVLPMLNGIRHLDVLDERFGADCVLGGTVFIAATVGEKGEIVHLNDRHGVTFGERDGTMSERVKAIDQLMGGARFDHVASPNVLHEMWQKWVFLATLAGSTSLTRASIGDIAAAPGGRELVLGILAECQSIAAAAGYRLSDSYLETTRRLLTAPGSPFTASMLRDIEAGAPIEGDHIIGDLLARGDSPLLRIVYTALKAYEARREVKNERSG